jgi:HEPN domain-containing protein
MAELKPDTKKLGTEFTAEVYKQAAIERIGVLQALYDGKDYTMAAYAAGLAVESILRAYRSKIDPEFDSRHDLYELAIAARFAENVTERSRERYDANLGAVASRWSNNHRFRSEAALRARYKRAKLDRGVQGDFLKENVRRLINAAMEVVTLGATRWKS